MKKVIMLLLSLMLCVALCACNTKKEMTAAEKAKQELEDRQRELDRANENLEKSRQRLEYEKNLIDDILELQDSLNP